ncbi:hypothetical protein [Senegalia massiliensis]|uniref:Lipoprotein n=1 Tax=Senegalia massiliensis TaxID=1720316 RepID=A0A845R0D0_9CLOT|nr:hypothetical protein [Senegalia massiliensis]NBI08165.1 hypothetical protein [Senegalia massiliensis]
MGKNILIFILLLVILGGCSFNGDKTVDSSIPFKEGAIFSTESFLTYSVRGDYKEGKNYFLQLSVNVPAKDGNFTKKVLKGAEFKAEENTKILSDSILVEDIKDMISQNDDYDIKNLKDEWKNFDYTVDLYNMKNGNLENGSGITKKIK